jgi:hypothetical protein
MASVQNPKSKTIIPFFWFSRKGSDGKMPGIYAVSLFLCDAHLLKGQVPVAGIDPYPGTFLEVPLQ